MIGGRFGFLSVGGRWLVGGCVGCLTVVVVDCSLAAGSQMVVVFSDSSVCVLKTVYLNPESAPLFKYIWLHLSRFALVASLKSFHRFTSRYGVILVYLFTIWYGVVLV